MQHKRKTIGSTDPVLEDLDKLAPFEMPSLDPRAVLVESLNGEKFLRVRYARGHRLVGKEDEDTDSHGDDDEPEDGEHGLPGLEAVICVEQEAVGDSSAHDGCRAGAEMLEAHASLICSGIVRIRRER